MCVQTDYVFKLCCFVSLLSNLAALYLISSWNTQSDKGIFIDYSQGLALFLHMLDHSFQRKRPIQTTRYYHMRNT